MATDNELWWWPARRVAGAIARRQLSAREYLDALLARVDALDSQLGAVVTRDERAREEAFRADQAVIEAAVEGRPLPPLHGVAMTVKDSLSVAALRTTGGVEELRDYVPREDAAAVAGARRAGAIVYGKTNLPAGSGDLQTYNSLFGTTVNPWAPDRTPGGSSGGSAAALACGLTPLEMGSDIAGSVRIPAASCGVVGHKPSFGVVSMWGHVPPAPYKPGLPDLSVVGPLARDVDDVELLLEAIAGPHPWDRSGWHIRLAEARPIRRVAVWSDDSYAPVDDEVRRAVEEAAEALAGCGVDVGPGRPLNLTLEANDLVFRRLLATAAVAETSADHVAQVSGGTRLPPDVLGGEFVAQTYKDWSDADDLRSRIRLEWQVFFTRYDALLVPVTANRVPHHDHRPVSERTVTVNGVRTPYWNQTVWAGLASAAYLPSTVVPVRLDPDGLPIGVAVVAPYLADRTSLAVARMLMENLPAIGRPPMATAGRPHQVGEPHDERTRA